MIVLETPVSDAPRRTDAGAKMWSCPTGLATTVKAPRGCLGCPKSAAHNIAENLLVDVPLGQHRYGMIPVTERPDTLAYHRIQAALWLRHYVHNGYIGDATLYNAGSAGDNASQAWRYEMIDAGVGFLTLRGPNPKRLSFGASRESDGWPLSPDSATGQHGRLVWDQAVGAMPPCAASVEFLYPSVLGGKAFPLITAIVPPESDADVVEFDVLFGDGFDATHALSPYDLAYVPGAYECVVRFEFLRPQTWLDHQAPREAQWQRRRMVFMSPGTYELTDANDGPTRILWPDSSPGAFRIVSTATGDWPARLLTTKTATGYITTIDLTGLEFNVLTIVFYAEAVDNVNAGAKSIAIGQCIHAKLDPSGSYVHGESQHCSRVDSTGFQADLFHDNCWLPGRCNSFQATDESIDTAGNHGHRAALWTRQPWILLQGIPGISNSRNFVYEQKGGASIEALLGSFVDQVPRTFVAHRTPIQGRRLGRRFTYPVPNDGGHRQALLYGAFWAAADARAYAPDAFLPFLDGALPILVDEWKTGKAIARQFLPWRFTGNTHVHTYASGSSSMNAVNTPTVSESYVVNVDVIGIAELAETNRIRAIYA